MSLLVRGFVELRRAVFRRDFAERGLQEATRFEALAAGKAFGLHSRLAV